MLTFMLFAVNFGFECAVNQKAGIAWDLITLQSKISILLEENIFPAGKLNSRNFLSKCNAWQFDVYNQLSDKLCDLFIIKHYNLQTGHNLGQTYEKDNNVTKYIGWLVGVLSPCRDMMCQDKVKKK